MSNFADPDSCCKSTMSRVSWEEIPLFIVYLIANGEQIIIYNG